MALISERERRRREKADTKLLDELLASNGPIPHCLLVNLEFSRPPKGGYWKNIYTEIWTHA